MKSSPFLLCSVLLTASIAAAQSRQVPAPEQTTPILLIGGQIHPVSGPMIPDGWVLLNDGKIE